MNVFFAKPTQAFTLMDISRMCRLAHTSTKQNLRKLVQQGMVLKTNIKKGKRIFPMYEANRTTQFTQYQKISTITALVDSGVLKYVEERFHPHCVVAFTSYQQGEDVEGASICLFIQAKRRAADTTPFEKKLGRKIKLFVGDDFREYPAGLRNSIINGDVLSGHLEAGTMETAQEIIKEIEKHRGEIKTFGVKKLTLFGSYAQGTATSQSDLDFLVEYQEGRGLFDDHVHLHQLLEDIFQRKIDLGEPDLLRDEVKKNVMGGRTYEVLI